MVVLSAQQNFIICDGVKSSQVRNINIRNECYILWLGLKKLLWNFVISIKFKFMYFKKWLVISNNLIAE